MKAALIFLTFAGFALSLPAAAEIYKCTDDSGVATFTDNPRTVTNKRCTSMNLDPMIINAPARSSKPSARRNSRSTTTPTRAETPSPSGFPRVDSGTQQKRDATRRQVLEDEMAMEQKLLGESQANFLSAQTTGDGRRITQSRNEVTAHEKNIEALQKELQRLR